MTDEEEPRAGNVPLIVFWFSTLVFAAAAFSGFSIYWGVKTDPGGGGGMALIYFLPLCAISIVAGLVASLLRVSVGDAWSDGVRIVGSFVGALVLLEVVLVMAAIALD